MRNVSLFAISISLVALLGSESESAAFNESTHRRIVETAAEVLRATERPGLPAVPGPGGSVIPAATWDQFIARLSTTNRRLSYMRTGLTGAYKGALERDVMDPEAIPSTITPNSNAVSSRNDPAICTYNKVDASGLELNLLNAAQVKIGDFPYNPADEYRPCAYAALPLARTTEDDRARRIGAVLGWHAASVDWRTKDSATWVKPTSSIFAGGLFTEALSRGFEYYLGALLVPVLCLKEIFSESASPADCADDAFDLSRKLNPVEYLPGILPGIPAPGVNDFVGFWHFIDVDASVNRYNEPRGLFWENAGPSHPGIMDVAIMVAADAAGLTINPFEAEGIKRYGRFDDVSRTGVRWNAHTIAHTEFSPVSNLARHGWDNFGGANAAPLAFPLHAIGDAAAPHHVVGTSSWGHRPFEDGVAFRHDEVAPLSDAPTFPGMRDRVLAIALQALQGLDANPSIEQAIRVEAELARALAKADDDWVFQDINSERYFVFGIGSKTAAINSYRKGAISHLRPFVELAIGHTIAFLVKAGERVGDAEPAVNPISRCRAGEHFTGVVPGCGPASVSAPLVSLPPGVAETSSVCAPVGGSCGHATDCCDGSALCQSNVCVRPGPTCKPSGGSCFEIADCCFPLSCYSKVCSDCRAPCTVEGGTAECGGSVCFRGCCVIDDPN